MTEIPPGTGIPLPEQFEICDWHLDLTQYEHGEPVPLPQGWRLVACERRANELACVLMRAGLSDQPADEPLE